MYSVDPSPSTGKLVENITAWKAALPPGNVCKAKLPISRVKLTTYYIEKWHFYKVWKESWHSEIYVEYLIHYPLDKSGWEEEGENDGVEQRFDCAECEDYHHVLHHLFLHLLPPSSFSCRVTQRSNHVKSFSLSLTFSFLACKVIKGTGEKEKKKVQSSVNWFVWGFFYSRSLQMQPNSSLLLRDVQ